MHLRFCTSVFILAFLYLRLHLRLHLRLPIEAHFVMYQTSALSAFFFGADLIVFFVCICVFFCHVLLSFFEFLDLGPKHTSVRNTDTHVHWYTGSTCRIHD
jgi:hypothetical protein